MAHHSSPTEVEVACFYTAEREGGQYQSVHSNTSSIRIQKMESTTTQMTPTSMTTTGLAASVSADPVGSLSTSVTSVKPATVSKVTTEATTDTLTSTLLPVTQTNSSPETVSKVTKTANTDTLTSIMLPVTQTNSSPELQKWMFIALPGFGVTVGIIVLGVTVVCYKTRSEKKFRKRSQVNMSDDFMSMTNIDCGEQLPAGTEAYSMINFVPAAERRTELPTRQASRNENSDVYHVYATIPDDPPATTLMNTTYSTIQAH
ncbi:chitinase 3-like isoform X3 [Stegastes partitus]|uniref:Chitinase 3-like isoform X3 n=1 Tax=Stegastes partitus TaxID=144197 RepID=A0A9Y4NV31_9TELE|nr:PREDICTED: chitinase 3-like isoform X3 [Stegastes partitus]